VPLRPGRTLEEIGAFSKAAVRFSEEALKELRALPAPEADRAGLNELSSLFEQQTDVLRQVAVMASAGDTVRALMLWDERVRLADQAEALGYDLRGCPVALPNWTFAGGGGTQESVDRLARAAYSIEAAGICQATSDRFHAAVAEYVDLSTLEDRAAFSEAAVRFSEEALAELRALPASETDRTALKRAFSLLERQVDLERQMAAAASAGDHARWQSLAYKRVAATRASDGLGYFWGCPVALPA
jgi:hypothetical protein